jgi:predicted glycosyltransferase
MFSAQNNNPRLIVTDEAGEDFNNRLILSSRLVITRTSTVGYNALALGVPLLSYALYDLLIEKHFATVGGAAIATSYADIVTQARRLLFDEDARTQLQQEQIAVRSQHMVLDGLCRERIGEVIRQAAI